MLTFDWKPCSSLCFSEFYFSRRCSAELWTTSWTGSRSIFHPIGCLGFRRCCRRNCFGWVGTSWLKASSGDELICEFIHRHLRYRFAPLGVCGAASDRQPTEWLVLYHVNCFGQCELEGLEVVLDCPHPIKLTQVYWHLLRLCPHWKGQQTVSSSSLS